MDESGKNWKAKIYGEIYGEMATVNPELNHIKRKDGRYAILIRVSFVVGERQVHKRSNSDQFVTAKKHFNPKAKYGSWVSSKEPDSDKINKELVAKVEKIKDHYLKTGSANLPPVISGDGFFKYALHFIEKYNNEKSYGTYRTCQSKLTKLAAYLGFKREKWEDIPVRLGWEDITLQFINSYAAHLKKLGNDVNSVSADLRKIKTIYNQAVKEDVVEYGKNPFLKIKLERKKSKKERLTVEDLNKLRSAKLTPGTRAEQARDIFLFCVNISGMRISDALLMKVEQVSGGRAFYQMRKTGDPMIIKLNPEAQKIVNRYSKGKKPGDYLFPFLDTRLSAKLNLRITSSTSIINKKIRYVAKLAKVDKHISSHVARHTYSQLALNKIREQKGSIETLQRALGHSDLATTKGYAEELDNSDVDALNDSISFD